MIDYIFADKLKLNYQNNSPFPHIVIDDFLPDYLLETVLKEIETHNEWYYNTEKWVEEFQVNKFYYPNHDTNEDDFRKKLPLTKFTLDFLNSQPVLDFLEKITGFKNLFRDPYLIGGGIHKIGTGGKLSIHKDYNVQPGTKKCRKLNLLIYLNKNWRKEWNGNLELISDEQGVKSIEIEPLFNRAVIFNIENALHGHPIPLRTPENIFRYSLALYYYTEDKVENEHSVIFYKNEEIKQNQLDKIFKISN